MVVLCAHDDTPTQPKLCRAQIPHLHLHVCPELELLLSSEYPLKILAYLVCKYGGICQDHIHAKASHDAMCTSSSNRGGFSDGTDRARR